MSPNNDALLHASEGAPPDSGAGTDASRQKLEALQQRIAELELRLPRAEAEARALVAREAKYRTLVENSQDVVTIVSPDGHVQEAMGNTMGLLGYTPNELMALMFGSELSEFHPDDRESISQWWAALQRWSASSKAECRVLDRAGEYRWVEITASPLYDDAGARTGYQCVLRDIGERIKAQDALVQAETLGALGQMAGGIAHDFNNILVSVLGYADSALADLATDPASVKADLERIIKGANDACEAIRRLQSFYRHGDDTSDFAPLQLDEVVREIVDLTEPTWKDLPQGRGVTVDLQTNLTAPPPVLGNASELRRVLRNLVANAVEAMPNGGRLALATRRDRAMSIIEVTDSGVGMSEQQRQHLFEAFYTTKPSTGSGLGLTVSRSIVRRHGGDIQVASEPGRGTTFTIKLPSAPAQRMRQLREQVKMVAQPAQPAPSPSLRTLIVDDEEAVRALLRRLMEREGHTATVTGSGREALELLARQTFDLVITDLGMPDVTGRDVAARACSLRPGLPIILTTGWGETITPEQIRDMHVAALLAKPFTRQKLSEALSCALAGSPAEPLAQR